MKFKNYLITTSLLWTAHAYADFSGLKGLPNSFKCEDDIKTKQIEITVPNVRSSDGNLCYAALAAQIMQLDICRMKKEVSCNSPNQQVSLLFMSLFNKDISGQDQKNLYAYNEISPFKDGSTLRVLRNVHASTNLIVKEECAPADVFVNKSATGREQEDRMTKMLGRLKDSFDRNKRGEEKCLDCLVTTTAHDLAENFHSKATNAEILSAFGQKTYEEFLAKVLVPEECTDDPSHLINWVPSGNFLKWPEAADDRNIDSGMKKIAENIHNGKVMGLQGICLDRNFDGTHCTEPHDVLVHGYCEKMCDSSGSAKVCRKAMKIQAFWGQTWQDMNHDGWVDAEPVLEQTPYNKPNAPVMFWIEPRKQSI